MRKKSPVHHPEAAHKCSAEVNLAELQKTLDAQGLEVVEHQKESVVGRKALSDKTKGECSPESYATAPSL